MRHVVRSVLVGVVLLLLPEARAVEASPIRDQGFDPGVEDFGGGIGSETYQIAQTFTVGITGKLTSVDIFINGTYIPGDVFFSIIPTMFGVPLESSASLVSVTIPNGLVPVGAPSDPPMFYNVDLTEFDVLVSAGDVLAIRLSATGNFGFGGRANNSYANGQFFERRLDLGPAWHLPWQPPDVAPNTDMGFFTYVEPFPAAVPEPGTMILLGSGIAMMSRRWLKRAGGKSLTKSV